MPELIQEILTQRGLTESQELESLFSPQLKNLRDPLLLHDMDVALEHLVTAHKERHKIAVYGDFDLDGTSGLALLTTAFEELGYESVVGYQPARLTEGYGVHAHAIEKLHEQGVQTIVTVDVGITGFDAALRAKELGIHMIVTDHHLPKEELPEALAIVNPNRNECESGLGHLCGAGVAFYLVMGLRRVLKEQGLLQADFNLKELLDCFVIGTLTDMVPLIDENRVLVKHGLLQLAKTKRPGLRALLQELNLAGKSLSASDVAIRFAPKINALSRMEEGLRPIDLYQAQTDQEGRDLVGQVMSTNEKRVRLQSDAEKSAKGMIEKEISQQDGFIWLWSKDYHRGVVGLVATRLAQEFGVPSFVGAEDGEGNIVGSARLPGEGFASLLEAFETGRDSLVKFGGHAAAAGFELKAEQAEEFRQSLKNHYENLEAQSFEEVIHYDVEAKMSQIDAHFMKWHEGLGPYGIGFESPLFKLSRTKISEYRVLRGGHIRFRLEQGGEQREALWFSPPKSELLDNKEELLGKDIDLLVEPQWNTFAGRKKLQFLIKEARLS